MEYREQDPFAGLNYTPAPNKRDAKLAQLAQRKQAKLNELGVDQKTPEQIYNELYGGTSESNSWDAAQSSIMQSVGNIADMGYNVYDRAADAFGFNKSDRTGEIASEVDKWSEAEYANKAMGYDPTAYDQDMAASLKDVEAGNYWEAGKRMLPNAIETIARSAGMIGELGAGALLAPVTGGASAVATTSRLANIVGKAYQGIKNASLYGAAQANRLAEQYEAETGQQKPAAEVAQDFAIATALGSMDLSIFAKATKSGTLGTFKSTMIDLVNTARPDKSVGKVLVGNVVKNASRIAATGGAEAVQEYLETWHEILATSDKDWADQLKVEANQNEAILGAIVGAGTGSALSAPGQIASTATVGVVGGGAKVARTAMDYGIRKGVEGGYKILPQEDRDAINAEYEANAKQYEETKAYNDAAINNISKATNIDELRSMGLDEVDNAVDYILDKDNKVKDQKKKISEATSIEELNKVSNLVRGLVSEINESNPNKQPYILEELQEKLISELSNRYPAADLNANFEKIKNQAIAQYNAINTKNKAVLEGVRAKDFVYQANKNLYKGVKEATEKLLPKDVREELLRQARAGIDIAKSGVDIAANEIKNLNKSTVRAIIDDISKGKINKAIYNFSADQLKELQKGFKDNPKAMAALNKAIEKQKSARSEFKDVLKGKDKSFINSLVDAAGKVKKSNVAMKIRGVMEATSETLKDSDSLFRYKQLVNDLEKEREKNPDQFTPEQVRRLRKAKEAIVRAINNKEEGAVNTALRDVKELYRKNKTDEKLKEFLGKSVKRIHALTKLYTKKTEKAIEESDVLSKLNEYIDEIDKKLDEEGKGKSGIKKEEVKKEKTTVAEPETKESSASTEESVIPDMSKISAKEYEKLGSKYGGLDGLASILSYADIADLTKNPDMVLSMMEAEILKETKDRLKNSVLDNEISTAGDKAVSGKIHPKMEEFVENVLCKGQ